MVLLVKCKNNFEFTKLTQKLSSILVGQLISNRIFYERRLLFILQIQILFKLKY
jgi:hypothetical protein